MILYVKTERDPSTTLAAVQNEIRNLDPALPSGRHAHGKRKVIDQALWGAKSGVGLSASSDLLAWAFASVGLYGIMAVLREPTDAREIGVRMALGGRSKRCIALYSFVRETVVGLQRALAVGAGLGIPAWDARAVLASLRRPVQTILSRGEAQHWCCWSWHSWHVIYPHEAQPVSTLSSLCATLRRSAPASISWLFTIFAQP